MWTEYLDLAKLALQCLAAQWFGYGKVEDYCGDCIKCATIRWALVLSFFAVMWLVSPTALIGMVVAWAGYSALSGKGWAGTFLHDKALLLWDKIKNKS